MREKKSNFLWADIHSRRDYRTEEEFKAALRSGALPWSEIERYIEWRKDEIKDSRMNLRINSTDRMKLKALARMQGKKYMTYIGEILKREIYLQEDLMADFGRGSPESRNPRTAPRNHQGLSP
jgi:predicted DNA binding CopG/RHH family protein